MSNLLDDKLLPFSRLQDFARRWNIEEISLFGSALTPEFSKKSDIDLLIRFETGAPWGLLELVRMQEELEQITGRSVDLVSKNAIERSSNKLRKAEILGNAQVIYAARPDNAGGH